jgi:hypothetical protein
MTAHQISLITSPMGRSIDRFAAMRQWDRVYNRDSYPPSLRVSNFIQISIAVERRLVRIKPLPLTGTARTRSSFHRETLRMLPLKDLLAKRGIMVSYETIRRWVNHFGLYAAEQY